MKKTSSAKRQGFTFLELLLVVSALVMLATLVVVLLNPAQRFADTRNSRRRSEVNNILTALNECIVDNGGIATTHCLPAMTTDTTYEIVSSGTTGCDAQCPALPGNCANLAATVDFLKYLKTLPVDPRGGTAPGHTGYSIREKNGMHTISACAAESAVIEVSR